MDGRSKDVPLLGSCALAFSISPLAHPIVAGSITFWDASTAASGAVVATRTREAARPVCLPAAATQHQSLDVADGEHQL